jgi:Amt family ammonium transporter
MVTLRERSVWTRGLVLGALVLGTVPAFAQDAPPPLPDSGDTAWMLMATGLVLFMTIPGLSLFYAGLVRRKNVLSVLMQCFAITGVVTLLWILFGYSATFATGGMEAGKAGVAAFIGNPLEKFFLLPVTRSSVVGTIPESVFVVYQLTFAIITPALIIGAFAERMKFSAMLIFSAVWTTFSYFPVAHMSWGGAGGFLYDRGMLDFAGGVVVHTNAGIAALIACIMVGKRTGYPERPMPPHNLTMAVTGAGMLWVGWFGFNAGSALSAGQSAGYAMLVTHSAGAVAAVVWMGIEWVKLGKPSALGIITGAVAGLAAVTPAAGSTGLPGALLIGVVSSVACFFAATSLKRWLGYDDTLDAFGVHGVGGILGTLLTGVACQQAWGGVGFGPGVSSVGGQLAAQLLGIGVTMVLSGVVSVVTLKALDMTIGLRVNGNDEEEGLDLSQHGEDGYVF